jgi:hypothetical protein
MTRCSGATRLGVVQSRTKTPVSLQQTDIDGVNIGTEKRLNNQRVLREV